MDKKEYKDTFIAYKGKEIGFKKMYEFLLDKCPTNYMVSMQIFGDAIFAKIIYDDCYMYDKEPYYKDGALIVGEYCKNELDILNKQYSKFEKGESHKIINYIYKNNGISMFEKLKDKLNFSSVILDINKHLLIAGTTKDVNLYYSFIKETEEIIFSNNSELINELFNTKEIKKIEENSYIIDCDRYYLNNNKKYTLKKMF